MAVCDAFNMHHIARTHGYLGFAAPAAAVDNSPVFVQKRAASCLLTGPLLSLLLLQVVAHWASSQQELPQPAWHQPAQAASAACCLPPWWQDPS
jgi:hypothetical protein